MPGRYFFLRLPPFRLATVGRYFVSTCSPSIAEVPDRVDAAEAGR